MMTASEQWKKTILWAVVTPVLIAVVLVGMHLLQYFIPTYPWGIHPRRFEFTGLFLAPFIHASWAHLWGNLAVLCLIVPLCVVMFRKQILWALPVIWVVSFMWVWLFGAPGTVHVGASGIVYGLVFFAMTIGFLHRSWLTIVGSLISITVFSYFLHSLFSVQQGVSFAAHLGGAVGGVLSAWMWRKKVPKPV